MSKKLKVVVETVEMYSLFRIVHRGGKTSHVRINEFAFYKTDAERLFAAKLAEVGMFCLMPVQITKSAKVGVKVAAAATTEEIG